MPIYEYRCAQCSHEFEKRVTFAQASVRPDCPVCKALRLRRSFRFSARQV